MKKMLFSAVLASTALFAEFSNACPAHTETPTPVTADTRIECGGTGTNRTVAYSAKTWGGWSQLNTDTESTTNGVTNHRNAVYGYPFVHTCKVEYSKKNGSSYVGFGNSGKFFCL